METLMDQLTPSGLHVAVDDGVARVEIDLPAYRHNIAELRRATRPEAGFMAVHARPLPPDPEAKGPLLFVATGARPSPAREDQNTTDTIS